MSKKPMRCKSDWDGRYQAGDTPWNLGKAPPHLEALVASLAEPALRVFVPGAGHGHDAVAWARAGHAVTALDIAPGAIAAAREVMAAEGVTFDAVLGDLFALPEDFAGAFDIVWEQTCLCALPPERRGDYARAVASVLRPGGRFHAVLWEHGKEGGPPWSLTEDVAREVLEPGFEIDAIERIPDWGTQRWNEFTVRAARL
jgi:SAM-dependent methyltransferase